jgi:tetratricopeptide (TPR) repeat protein
MREAEGRPGRRSATRTLTLLIGCSLIGCSTPSNEGLAPTPQPLGFHQEVVSRLEPGTRVRLRPVQVTVPAPGTSIDTVLLGAGLRESLRLSSLLDVAAGIEDAPSPLALVPTVDLVAGRLVLTLEWDGSASTPLCSVACDPERPTVAADELAARARIALGEDLRETPPPIADIYSASAECVRLTERSLELEPGGADLKEILERARRADPGCALTWNVLASSQLARGEPQAAISTARSALSAFGRRLSPTTAHRLARVLLLAEARVRGTPGTRAVDEQLLALGTAFVEDRPHDPHGLYTTALAHSFLGRFDLSEPAFEELRARWPAIPWPEYHLVFARLGLGDGPGALEAADQIARDLPFETTFLPRALALFTSGELGELADLLQEARDRTPANSPFGLDVLRMQAALAVLRDRRDEATSALADSLEWLRQRPSLLPQRAVELAEAGEALVLLGAPPDLSLRLDAIRSVVWNGEAAVVHALAYVEGIAAAARGDAEVAAIAAGTLEQANRDGDAARVRAAIARAAGSAADEARELATVLRLNDTPLARASFARVLRELGRREEAEGVLRETREDLLRIDLRIPLQHPLLSPGQALAFLATGPR